MSMKEIDNLIFQRQMNCLNILKTEIHSIRKAMDLLESKIDDEGIAAYYSCNHDVLRHAQKIWKAANTLGELKALNSELKK